MGTDAACIIGKANPDDAMGRSWPYLASVGVAMILVACIPWLALGFVHTRP